MNTIRKHRAKALPCSTPDPSAKANGNNSASAGGALQVSGRLPEKGICPVHLVQKIRNIFKKYSVTQPNSPEHNPN
jgi:hypothetical protein